jgi:hypothetical protein
MKGAQRSQEKLRPFKSAEIAPRLFPAFQLSNIDVALEEEAERIGDRVTNLNPANAQWSLANVSVNQKSFRNAPAQSKLESAPAIVREVLSSPGRALDEQTRRIFEPRFGCDFSKVRIHADPMAAESADALEARAYTFADHVVFGNHEYAPEHSQGRRLIAHELVHVAQTQDKNGNFVTINCGAEPRLFRQQQDPASAPRAFTLTLRYPPSQEERIINASPQQASTQVKKFLSHLEAYIAGGKEGLADARKAREESPVVSHISGVFGFVSLPDETIWIPAESRIAEAREALIRGDIISAARSAGEAARKVGEANNKVSEYREGTTKGAGRAEFSLEVVVATSAAVVAVGTAGIAAGAGGAGALTGLATGATAGGSAGFTGIVAGSAYGAAQQTARQASEVGLGLRREIDWGGIGFDALFGIVTGYLGGKLGGALVEIGGKFVDRFLTNPVTSSFGRRIATMVLADLVSGQLISVLHGASKMVFNAARWRKGLTVEGFIDEVIERLFDPRAAFLNLIMGAANRRLAIRAIASAAATSGALPTSRTAPSSRFLRTLTASAMLGMREVPALAGRGTTSFFAGEEAAPIARTTTAAVPQLPSTTTELTNELASPTLSTQMQPAAVEPSASTNVPTPTAEKPSATDFSAAMEAKTASASTQSAVPPEVTAAPASASPSPQTTEFTEASTNVLPSSVCRLIK